MLTKKVLNAGFEAIEIQDRRPISIDELTRYPVFPAEFVQFLRQAIPQPRHAELVWAVTLTALKPATPEGGIHAA